MILGKTPLVPLSSPLLTDLPIEEGLVGGGTCGDSGPVKDISIRPNAQSLLWSQLDRCGGTTPGFFTASADSSGSVGAAHQAGY